MFVKKELKDTANDVLDEPLDILDVEDDIIEDDAEDLDLTGWEFPNKEEKEA